MPESTWGAHSLDVILSQYREIKAQEPSLTTDQILKKINKEFYPYGERAYHPYKMWLKALKQAKSVITGSNTKTKKSKTVDENQASFDLKE